MQNAADRLPRHVRIVAVCMRGLNGCSPVRRCGRQGVSCTATFLRSDPCRAHRAENRMGAPARWIASDMADAQRMDSEEL